MSNLTKVKIARISGAVAFWMAIAVVYLQERGLSLSQIYQALSIYYIAVVILEFPTGVIGDYFSHRVSVMLGHFILGIAFIALAMGGGYNFYLRILLFVALGIALSSGSDTALLHSLSKDFKHDQSQIRFYTLLVAVVTTTLGSIIAVYNLSFPFIATGVFNFVTAFFLLSMKNTNHTRKEGNVFKTAFKALSYVRNSKRLRNTMIISGAIGAFSFSIKWFYNPLLQMINMPLSLWGVLISVAMLVPLAGVKVYQKSKSVNLIFILILFLFSIIPIGVSGIFFVPLIFLYFNGTVRGYLETLLDVEINNAIEIHERASILSLNNLLIRLGASVYTPIAGLVLEKSSFLAVTSGTMLLLLLITTYPAFLLSRKK